MEPNQRIQVTIPPQLMVKLKLIAAEYNRTVPAQIVALLWQVTDTSPQPRPLGRPRSSSPTSPPSPSAIELTPEEQALKTMTEYCNREYPTDPEEAKACTERQMESWRYHFANPPTLPSGYDKYEGLDS